MDSFTPFQTFLLPELAMFRATKYEEYQNGQMIDSGECTILIKLSSSNGKISCLFGNNNLYDKLSSCTFDACITLPDRLLLMSNPLQTNANIPVIAMLSSILDYTCEKKDYDPTEPVVGSIYTMNGHIVKMSFTMSNPERLIELY